MNRWLAALPLAILAALGVIFAAYGLRHDPHVAPAALVGKPLPGRLLTPLAGGPAVPLATVVRGPTVVNVFASWCVPCAEEAPALLALKAEGARIVGVDYKDDPQRAKGFLQRFGDPFDLVLTDRDGRGGVDLGISGVPETFLVGANGVVIAKDVGPITPKDAEALLERANAETR